MVILYFSIVKRADSEISDVGETTLEHTSKNENCPCCRMQSFMSLPVDLHAVTR